MCKQWGKRSPRHFSASVGEFRRVLPRAGPLPHPKGAFPVQFRPRTTDPRRRVHFRIRTRRFRCVFDPAPQTHAGGATSASGSAVSGAFSTPHRGPGNSSAPAECCGRSRTMRTLDRQPSPREISRMSARCPTIASRLAVRGQKCILHVRRGQMCIRNGRLRCLFDPAARAGTVLDPAARAGPRTSRPGAGRLSGCWRGRPEGSARQRMPRHQVHPRSRRRAG